MRQSEFVGFVFQDYALFPHLDVTANIDYGLGDLPAAERRQRVREIMERFELTPLAKQRPRQLSGGEQQRVALARALVGRPRLLLLDEPLSAIDAVLREELRGFLRTMLLACRIPVVLVTHDRAEALALGDELVVMSGGTVLQSGPVLEVFNRPIDPAVARIVHVETLHPGKIRCLSEGLATVVVGNTEIIAIAPNTAGTDVLICIRGEDVILERGSGSPSSVRNRLPARVIAIHAGAPLQRVELDAGFPLFALVTRLGSEELGLKVGEQVIALIKAPAIHLIARAK
jgi:molybdate transport system ATP-binding protein